VKIPLERLFQEPPLTGSRLTGVEWHPDGLRFTYLQPAAEREQPADLWAYTLASGERERLVEGATLVPEGEADEKPVPLEGYRWSRDGERIYLHHGGTLWSYHLPDRRLARLLTDLDRDVPPHPSPGGERLAFLREGNLWVLDRGTGDLRALTTDGDGETLNGKLDWVYWEELGHRRTWRAFEWSPGGRSIAFLRLDQSRVPEYPLVDVMAVHPPVTLQRYPKAGNPNSVLSLRIVAAADGRLLAQHAEESDAFYLGPDLAWTPDGHGVTYIRLRRDQRYLELRLLEPTLGTDRLLLTESDPHWLNPIGPPHFLPDGTFLWLSERTGHTHLYRYSLEGECLHAVTEGEWQVEKVHTVADGYVYFTGTGEDARERHLYRARTHDQQVERLTAAEGVHDPNLSPHADWALVILRTSDRPAITQLLHTDGTHHATIREPDPAWEQYNWARSEFVDLTAEDGTRLHSRLLKPVDFDPSRRYPVVAHVYGGPHAQTVLKSWAGVDPLDQLLVQAGILVWRLDNRGSWGRGHAFEAPVEHHLGEVELWDQLAGVEYLKSLPYVDPERLGITGWSYGGYLTLYALTHAPEVWRCGVAGAPVTDWKLYDSIYTERYMGTPEQNPEGYRASSPLHAAEHLAAPLLLVHGTDDDNVHLQHTLQFVEALSRHRKPYELLIQPQQKHGFSGESVRTYTHERMLEFFTRHLIPAAAE
jgi:dipeptidyl-peptidase-4